MTSVTAIFYTRVRALALHAGLLTTKNPFEMHIEIHVPVTEVVTEVVTWDMPRFARICAVMILDSEKSTRSDMPR